MRCRVMIESTVSKTKLQKYALFYFFKFKTSVAHCTMSRKVKLLPRTNYKIYSVYKILLLHNLFGKKF